MRGGLVAAAAVWLLAIHMVLLASAPPIIRHLTIHAADWPANTPPMRIVLMSDLHVSVPGDSAANLAATVARVDALHPDLVLIAGDFLSTETAGVRSAGMDLATAPLAGLHARLGTVAVLGNHDYAQPIKLSALLATRGVAVLENRAMQRGPITILGFGDLYSKHAKLPGLMTQYRKLGGWPIVLSHTPDIVPRLPPTLPLILAGHLHCGQVRIPLLSPPASVSNYGTRYLCGVVKEPTHLTVVGAGLGVSQMPLRFAAAPDFWMIKLGR